MTDYYQPTRQYSYRGEPTADEHDAIRRSITRGSHQSQSQASASASTRSWVHANQIHRPPPPPEHPRTPTPPRRSRPLPEPQLYQSRTAFQYPSTQEEETDYATAEAHVPTQLPFGYPVEQHAMADEVISIPASLPLSGDGLAPGPTRGGRSFVGGFFSGLKRLPRIVLGGSAGNKGRGKLKRKGTFGTETEGTSTSVTGMTRGNTLPRYLSNPSIGPTNPEFAHRLSMAVANGSLPPESSPAVFSIRSTTAGPQFPILTVTPASDEIAEEERADFYDGPTLVMDPQPHFVDDSSMQRNRELNDRATVMVYSSDSHAPTITPANAANTGTAAPQPARQPTPGPRVSYQTQLPTRERTNAPSEVLHSTNPLVAGGAAATPGILHNPPNAPSPGSPRDVTSVSSPNPASSYTISAVPSFYDPSFASDLTPIEKFFKGLYNLPWIAPERVTVDYRPGNSDRAKAKVKGMKKPMASWYRAIVSRSRRASRDLDLLSSGDGTSLNSARLRDSLSPLGSPISRRSGRSSNGTGNKPRRTSTSKRHRKHRHRMTTSTSTSGVPTFNVPQRSHSPIIPTMYPYSYPPYPYYNPYGGFPAPVPVPAPRGPRAHRRHKNQVKYPYGYAPGSYQPMAIPPQMSQMGVPPPPALYVIAPSPPQSQMGAADPGTQQQHQTFPQTQPWPTQFQPQPQTIPVSGPMQISPVIMQFVPGAFGQNPNNQAIISPPLTPERQTHANS